ncbi:hypothetical protein Tsubulata_024649 [Turnera subulata]|uniref:Uncharacterized protein n=1 Tax=Turnera subulata TaxID=218843 RepID=A0A9Q0FXL7_9ROSI|nr:hypothetical protein Tsubulata_024649 [Turnera subulata]
MDWFFPSIGIVLFAKLTFILNGNRHNCRRIIELHEECLRNDKPDRFSRTLEGLAELGCDDYRWELKKLSKVIADTRPEVSYPREECRRLKKAYDEASDFPHARNASVAAMSDLKCHGKN